MVKELKKLIDEGKIMEALAYPFYKELPDGTTYPDVRWLPKGKVEAMCVPFITGNQVRQRLNDVLGAKWQDRMEKHEDRTLCILSIYIDGEWRDRTDVGTPSREEKEKGETTDALKRAAKNWGVGAYLDGLPNVTLPYVRANGKNVPATPDKKNLLRGDNLSNYINTLSLPMGKLIEFWSSLDEKQQRDLTPEIISLKKKLIVKKKIVKNE